MKKNCFKALFAAVMFLSCSAPQLRQDAIISGIAWFDDRGEEVNAHASCVVEENGVYYLFGEAHTDDNNEYKGINCYSSTDLINWKFENQVLGLQPDGLLGPGRVGERAKVMRSPLTGEYVMFLHTDDMKYMDPHVGYAVCDRIDGDYRFMGELNHGDSYIRRWDLSVFQDSDGTGYLLTHEGNIYRLAPDYRSVDSVLVEELVPGGEAPVMLKRAGRYYWTFSGKTSWERNDNFYLTATSLAGPWERKGLFCPEGKTTWNSQGAFALPVVAGLDTMFVYMGDRWSFPKQESAATYVWQPLTVGDGEISIPEFQSAWRVDFERAEWETVEPAIRRGAASSVFGKGEWEQTDEGFRSREAGVQLSATVKGRRIALFGISEPHSGYAKVTINDGEGTEVLSTIVDFYSQYRTEGLKLLSPELPRGKYQVTVEVLGSWAESYTKSGKHFGSDDSYVYVTDFGSVR